MCRTRINFFGIVLGLPRVSGWLPLWLYLYNMCAYKRINVCSAMFEHWRWSRSQNPWLWSCRPSHVANQGAASHTKVNSKFSEFAGETLQTVYLGDIGAWDAPKLTRMSRWYALPVFLRVGYIWVACINDFVLCDAYHGKPVNGQTTRVDVLVNH